MTAPQHAVSDRDRAHLARAIDLARNGMRAREGGPFGAVLASGDRVLGEGWNRVTSTADPTAHAEMVALRRAGRATGQFEFGNATMYASGEPCPMCWTACRWARVERILYANDRAAAAAIGFDDQFLYDELARDVADHDVPVIQVVSDAGSAVYAEWAADESYVRY